MIKTARVALCADRWTPFAYVIRVDGVDLTGADLHAQVRLTPDNPQLLLDLPTVGSPTAQGVRLMRVDATGATPSSYLRIQIPGGSLGAAMPPAGELGDVLQLAWDLLVTLPGRTQARWLSGDFVLTPGETQLAAAPLAADPPPGAADAIVAIDGEALTVTITGADVLAPLYDAAAAARDAAQGSAAAAAGSAKAASLSATAAAAIARTSDSYADGVAQYGALPFAVLSPTGITFYTQANGSTPIATLPDLLALSGPGGADVVHFGQLPASKTLERSLASYGVDPDSAADQSDALIAAFAAAKADGVTRLIGVGRATYRLSKPLTIDSLVFDGRGCTIQRDDPANSRITVTGPGALLVDVQIHCPTAIHGDPQSVGRGSGPDTSVFAAVMFSGVTGGGGENITVQGGAGAGILITGCTGLFFGGRTKVTDTEADGFHQTGGSSFIVVVYYEAQNCGDDLYAVVAYRNEQLVENIWLLSALLRDGAARAITVAGGLTVKIGKVQVERSAAAALYVASDYNAKIPANSTLGSQDVYVEQLTAIDCVQSIVGYAIVQIAGQPGYLTDNVDIERLLVRGAGAKAVCALSVNQYAGRVQIEGKLYDIRGAQKPDLARLGGGDTTVRLEAERVGGDGIVFQGTETGLQRVRATKLSDFVKDGPTTFNAYIAWDAAGASATYDLEDVNILGGGTEDVGSLGGATPTPGALRAVGVRRDGRQVRRVDPIAEQWTYDGANFIIALTDRDEPEPFRQTIPAGGKLRISFSPPFRLVLELIAVAAGDQSRSVRLIESVSYEYTNTPAGAAGVDYVQIVPANGGAPAQHVARTRTGPGEGSAGDLSLIPVALAYDGANLWLDITPPVALDVRLALEVTRKTQ